MDSVMSAFDPNVWSGRALQENFVEWADAVLHQCIRPLIGAFELRAIMDISALCDLVSGQASMGHLGHQCSQAPGRPILHLVSNPLADLGR
jgi:hypothetical protein